MKPNQLAKHAFGLQTTGVGEALGCSLCEKPAIRERREYGGVIKVMDSNLLSTECNCLALFTENLKLAHSHRHKSLLIYYPEHASHVQAKIPTI